MRVLIVDDEPLACRGVAARLAPLTDIEVVGMCGDGATAVEHIKALAPDLVFLDVQMPGMTGFDVLRALPPGGIPNIIFLTAFDRHAVQAFDVDALDYLLKPIDDDRFDIAIARARRQRGALHYATRFVVRTGTRMEIVPTDEVEWIAMAGDYAELHTAARVHLVRETMRALETRLDPEQFLRIHRSRIVRVGRIRELRSIDNREYVIKLADGSQHRSSRTYADQLERWLAADKIAM